MNVNTSHLFGLIRLGARLASELSGFPDRSAQVARMPAAAAAVALLINSPAKVAPTRAASDQNPSS